MRYRQAEAALALMRRAPVMPVLTVADVADALEQAAALIAGGLPVMEVTLSGRVALKTMVVLVKAFPEAIIGAGAIIETEQIDAAIDAGAAFLTSPGMTPRLIEAAVRSPLPFLPGASSASEAMALRERGFRALKFFPAEAAGGANYVASLAGPLPDLIFCPTGGVDMDKAKNYLALDNVACVGGSWMLAPAPGETRDFACVEKLAREAFGLARRH
ncbi:bifunctional 4-hydroxy-2-oxoglutarate aldolase/2-dehydro-3-deoxy-phosphogluconate aldolase [Methylocapsa polymorpha]|uniref:Bifunctional 4-hydroxy-2-oxoglutarate aldolase/2-dehydro-3-deoxy-phosphogluconate aldolase n=1 Tax=Methylocapsa polymorpha TaxID=3080828 RepID=A0ABZ0HRW9_9HYPH|nr:bifunctional 4-hydroxy-2-oxoglutarate aldolase/2-dehydro-3-deoxy-phosphogluconate aldolase [Methylocapsa sp. RX1]